MLGSRKDYEFSEDKIAGMLERVQRDIHASPERTKASMNNFIYTVATSFKPLHEKALETAENVGIVDIQRENKKPAQLNAYENIMKQVEKGRIGFKRKYVRC